MFKSKPAAAAPLPAGTPRAPRSSVPTIISADMVAEGNFKTGGDMQVEGTVIGQIAAGRLVLAESGIIHGDVTAENARICGTLNGGVRGGTITLTATAKVTGDVYHDVLVIEAGGMLEGHSRRRVAKPAELSAPAADMRQDVSEPVAEPVAEPV